MQTSTLTTNRKQRSRYDRQYDCVWVFVCGYFHFFVSFHWLSPFSLTLFLTLFLPRLFTPSFLSFSPSLLFLLSLTPHSFHSLFCHCIPLLILPCYPCETVSTIPFPSYNSPIISIYFMMTHLNCLTVKTYVRTQRFCQSYMTELSKYIGPDIDLPGLGNGVNAPEIG